LLDETELSWSNFKVLSRHLLGGTEENPQHLSHDSWSPCRDLNLVCPEYETEFIICMQMEDNTKIDIKEMECMLIGFIWLKMNFHVSLKRNTPGLAE
jgi:hypothetical protein